MVCNQNKKLTCSWGKCARLRDSAEPNFGCISHQSETMVMPFSGVCLSSQQLCFMISYYKFSCSPNKLLTLRSGIGDHNLHSRGFLEEKSSLAYVREALALAQNGRTLILSHAASHKCQKTFIVSAIFSSSWTHNLATSRAIFSLPI